MAAMFSGKETGRASILKLPLSRFSLVTMLVGTVVVSLALETIPDWNIAVFIPMVARVFTAMLKKTKLHVRHYTIMFSAKYSFSECQKT